MSAFDRIIGYETIKTELIQRYCEINALAARFYNNSLWTIDNAGLVSLESRGLSKDAINTFFLGYASGDGHALVDYLRKEGVSDEDMLKLGLANRDMNELCDIFRERIMIPIINTHNEVIGFGGRTIRNDNPMLLNSPESEVFVKYKNLYGINLSKDEIEKEDIVILVESYMDMISLWQNGIRNVAASLGSDLTHAQAKLLCSLSENIILAYDSDSAGKEAALRGVDIINAAGGNPRVLVLPEEKDPAGFIKIHGKGEFHKLLKNAMPSPDFKAKTTRM